jgi:sugar lactone lactonase YvrE
MPEWEAEPVLGAGADLGESPVWDADAGELLWLDVFARRLHRFDPATGGDRELELAEVVSAVGLRRQGGLVCAFDAGLGLLDERTGAVELVAGIERDRPDRRMNDGAVDPAGRYFAGSTTDSGAEGASALYRLDADRSLHAVVDGVTESNGIDWSPDGRVMYYVDTGAQRLDAFAFDPGSGALGERRVLARFPEARGMPDGLTVDAEGCIWLAFWSGGTVRRFSPAGEEIGVVHVPAVQPTSCAFGGPGLAALYITSAACDLDAPGPHDGDLFVVRPGVPGRPPYRYEG